MAPGRSQTYMLRGSKFANYLLSRSHQHPV